MHLHAKSTALVLIDLQKGVLAMPVVPYSGATILARSTKFASGFRATGSPVVWVRVFFASNFADAPRAQVDRPTDHSVLPSGWDEFPHPLAARICAPISSPRCTLPASSTSSRG
jgi:nicotinamidase-related amidase